MTQKTLGQIAHEAGERIGAWSRTWAQMGQGQRDEWEAIAAAVASSVREDCAAVCEGAKVNIPSYFEIDECLDECAEAIRARVFTST